MSFSAAAHLIASGCNKDFQSWSIQHSAKRSPALGPPLRFPPSCSQSQLCGSPFSSSPLPVPTSSPPLSSLLSSFFCLHFLLLFLDRFPVSYLTSSSPKLRAAPGLEAPWRLQAVQVDTGAESAGEFGPSHVALASNKGSCSRARP